MSTAEARNLLTQDEQTELATLEAAIVRGLTTFLEVGTALLRIRDGRLYRDTFFTFEEYCETRWDLKRNRAYQIIEAAEVVSGMSKILDKPKVESQARALLPLPPAEREAAWDEAIATAPKGKLTAKHVEAIVDRKLGRAPKPPKAAPEFEPKPTGQTRINGVLAPDPPDVARLRAAGRIAADVVPDVHEPEPDAEPTPPAREPGSDDDLGNVDPDDPSLDDETWLETLPARAKIHEGCRKIFDADAIIFRQLEPHRKTYQHHATRIINKAGRRKGLYAYLVSRFLRRDHPKHWLVCPTTENGGCGGTGQIPLIGQCPKCHGRGYWIK